MHLIEFLLQLLHARFQLLQLVSRSRERVRFRQRRIELSFDLEMPGTFILKLFLHDFKSRDMGYGDGGFACKEKMICDSAQHGGQYPEDRYLRIGNSNGKIPPSGIE